MHPPTQVYPWAQWPFALLYFTGSGHFNRSMRLYVRVARREWLNRTAVFHTLTADGRRLCAGTRRRRAGLCPTTGCAPCSRATWKAPRYWWEGAVGRLPVALVVCSCWCRFRVLVYTRWISVRWRWVLRRTCSNLLEPSRLSRSLSKCPGSRSRVCIADTYCAACVRCTPLLADGCGRERVV